MSPPPAVRSSLEPTQSELLLGPSERPNLAAMHIQAATMGILTAETVHTAHK